MRNSKLYLKYLVNIKELGYFICYGAMFNQLTKIILGTCEVFFLPARILMQAHEI